MQLDDLATPRCSSRFDDTKEQFEIGNICVQVGVELPLDAVGGLTILGCNWRLVDTWVQLGILPDGKKLKIRRCSSTFVQLGIW